VSYCSELIAVESLALYNLSIDTDKILKSEIFKSNMIAWHIFAGVVGIYTQAT
jgi:anaerobic C4-dicarboxylate transporter